MLVEAGLERFVVFNKDRERTLMGREECQSAEDIEEGEISDSVPAQGVREGGFIKQEDTVRASQNFNSHQKKQSPRVWIQDLYKYPMSRNYASGLYNLAWAQAVQNKPLDEVLVRDRKSSDHDSSFKLKRSSSSPSMTGKEDNKASQGNKEVMDKDVIDLCADEDEIVPNIEKEEGELEEGEIDMDAEVLSEGGGLKMSDEGVDEMDTEEKEIALAARVNSIRETLESIVTKKDYVDGSFDPACSRIQKSLDSLHELVLENSDSTTDSLVLLSVTAIKAMNSVFCSMNQDQRERNKGTFLRLLSHAKSQKAPLFSPEQMEKIEFIHLSLDSSTTFGTLKCNNEENNAQITERVNQKHSDASSETISHNLVDSMRREPVSTSVVSLHHNDTDVNTEPLKLGPSTWGRGILLPLLDLHKDHDEDSLPSPTRAAPLLFPANNALAVRSVAVNAELVPQQKFGHSSFLKSDRLPSPTPSEECDDGGGDVAGEVSSSSIVGNFKTVNASIVPERVFSFGPQVGISSGQGLINVRNTGPMSSGPNPTLKSTAKSRDPRLRYANFEGSAMDINQQSFPIIKNGPTLDPIGEVSGLRKQKTVEELNLDGPAMKRQRKGLTDYVTGDMQTVSGSGAWLEDRGTAGPLLSSNVSQIVENTGGDPSKFGTSITSTGTDISTPDVMFTINKHLSGAGANTTASLQSLLKDIAMNPSMWMNIIKMEQQKSIDPTKRPTLTPSSNSILGAVPSMNITPKPVATGQRVSGILQAPPQSASVDVSGKIRMKPRDPRRALHCKSFEKNGSLGLDQSNTYAASSPQEITGNWNSQKQEDQSDKKSTSSQLFMGPDITQQLTKNLKNIADIVSVSQASITPVSQISASPLVQVHSSRVDYKGLVTESGHLQNGSLSSSEVAAGPSRSQNTWVDVEHLFDGFDDQQKAAIHRERARRIEEQKKMFAARKLCLVLDLDHTLLNSAKFTEVDPVHDDILRKKEEQDREKPQRHLFRFPHMGMWTKLRPGIWNFLEKASKLFELHLYTMGNKLYATEMAKLLDPKGSLFAGRVISRGDDNDVLDGEERVPKSKDLDGVLGMESAVVIIDDSVKVWPHNKLNMIVVERYIYFPCSRRQFGLLGPSLLEIDHDERPEDGTLASSLAVIEKIHQNFFSHPELDEADVRNILALEQRKILAGCRIVFSRVFPIGEANPHLHPLWQTAEQFGAVCTNQIDEQVTHVVANSLGTDKVNWALSTGRYVVHPGWVEASALLYRRANEQDFAITINNHH
ncbi:RNA polymerase II C-terminal domain phosphatase-like 3 isoform X2 [Diospyros lotus]|uniref:RNA polymerase II C-terminal domain phosphatase-like 3 isoform X2 n=1 Tax=Diospyros lotus TaxID=55363 RepID=UPI00224E8E61|nr:RNA polymerase II C-terminal domain phosphatase-like 3 isoform X2 [Diospyros lotus]